SSRTRHTRSKRDWSSDVCSSDLGNPDFSSLQVVAIVLSLAAGSVFASHVNDSGFWWVSRFFGMDTKTTLKTWTLGQTLLGLVGFGRSLVLYGLVSLFCGRGPACPRSLESTRMSRPAWPGSREPTLVSQPA